MESRGCVLRVLTLRPSAIEVLTLTIIAPQLHQRQLHLGSSFAQKGTEAEGRKFLGLEPTWASAQAPDIVVNEKGLTKCMLSLVECRISLTMGKSNF